MPTVCHEIVVNAPVQRVWDLVTDPQRLADWVTVHRDFPEGEPRALTQQTPFTQTMAAAGQEVDVEWTVVESREGEELVWEGAGPMGSSARTRVTLEDAGGCTRVAYEAGYDLPGGVVGAAVGKVAGGGADGEALESLQRLKALAESEGPTADLDEVA